MTQGSPSTCVITGAASGLGWEAARQLAAKGRRIIGIGRSPAECRGAAEILRRAVARPEACFIPADLSSVGGVRRAAAQVRKTLGAGRLDRLIHGAEAFAGRRVGTEDGLELQFATNYLAAFLLTCELFGALIRPPESRVIVVSSGSHRGVEMAWADPMLRRRYGALRAYRQSKLALVLFVLELNRRVRHRFPVRAMAVETGPAAAISGGGAFAGPGLSGADAAASIVRLTTEPLSAIAGDYWRLGRPASPSLYARRPDVAQRLWDLSERLCGVDFL